MIRLIEYFGHVRASARLLSLTLIATALATSPAAATTVTYTELIEDLNFETGTRDLKRTQTYGDGSVHVENDDATIAAPSQNDLTSNWGLSTPDKMSWLHRFIYVPPVETFISGKFTLTVANVEASALALPNDPVFLEQFIFPFFLLPPGVESVLTLATNNGSLLQTHLLDGKLRVDLLPIGPGAGDFMEIKSSRVDLTYKAVPEAGPSFALFGAVVAGMALVARRRSGAAARS